MIHSGNLDILKNLSVLGKISQPINKVASPGTSQSFDLSSSTIFQFTLTDNLTVNLNNPKEGTFYRFIVTQDENINYSLAFNPIPVAFDLSGFTRGSTIILTFFYDGIELIQEESVKIHYGEFADINGLILGNKNKGEILRVADATGDPRLGNDGTGTGYAYYLWNGGTSDTISDYDLIGGKSIDSSTILFDNTGTDYPNTVNNVKSALIHLTSILGTGREFLGIWDAVNNSPFITDGGYYDNGSGNTTVVSATAPSTIVTDVEINPLTDKILVGDQVFTVSSIAGTTVIVDQDFTGSEPVNGDQVIVPEALAGPGNYFITSSNRTFSDIIQSPEDILTWEAGDTIIFNGELWEKIPSYEYAINTIYTPTTLSDWLTQPNNVLEGLDQLAQRTFTLENGTSDTVAFYDNSGNLTSSNLLTYDGNILGASVFSFKSSSLPTQTQDTVFLYTKESGVDNQTPFFLTEDGTEIDIWDIYQKNILGTSPISINNTPILNGTDNNILFQNNSLISQNANFNFDNSSETLSVGNTETLLGGGVYLTGGISGAGSAPNILKSPFISLNNSTTSSAQEFWGVFGRSDLSRYFGINYNSDVGVYLSANSGNLWLNSRVTSGNHIYFENSGEFSGVNIGNKVYIGDGSINLGRLGVHRNNAYFYFGWTNTNLIAETGLFINNWGENIVQSMWRGGSRPLALPDTNMFQMWGEDSGIGNASPFFRTENGTVIDLYDNQIRLGTAESDILALDGRITTIENDVQELYISDVTLIGELENPVNWNNGDPDFAFTGSATGTLQGQLHIDDNYLYISRSSTEWIRVPRT